MAVVTVIVKFRPSPGNGTEQGEKVFTLLRLALPGIVLWALNRREVGDAHRTADDINITFLHAHRLDVGKENIEVVIIADDSPWRAQNLKEERIPQMQGQIRPLLDESGFKELTVSLCVGLVKGGSAEF